MNISIDANHLKRTVMQNVHIVRWPTSTDQTGQAVARIAAELDFCRATLNGKRIESERDALIELSEAFQFSTVSSVSEGEELNWNTAADLVGDLNWLVHRSNTSSAAGKSRGVVLHYREPERLLTTDPIAFATLLDTVGTRSDQLIRAGIPFHIVVGPMPQDYRYEHFINILAISSRLCQACQMVDEHPPENY